MKTNGETVYYHYDERGHLYKTSFESENGQTIAVYDYDNYGNRTRSGYSENETSFTYTWERGRLLKSITKYPYFESNYTYDRNGIRVEKLLKDAGEEKNRIRYYYDGTNLIGEDGTNRKIRYFYDAQGINGFSYNGTVYSYVKDMLGNVLMILQGGAPVARYCYDAWGNHKVLNPDGTENYDEGFIGNINPIRYRGYYYDVESGLYYLQSRYYDPAVGIFISPDSANIIFNFGTVVPNGLNFYSYCMNNPINAIDQNEQSSFFAYFSASIGFLKDLCVGLGGTIIGLSSKAFTEAGKLSMYLLDDSGRAVFNPDYLKVMSKAGYLEYSGKIINSMGTVTNIIGYTLLAVDIGLAIYNNSTNPNLSTSRKVTDSIVDISFSVGSFVTSAVLGAKIGAFIGSLIPIPIVATIVGTVVGAIVGSLIGLGVYFFQQSQLYQDIKIWFNSIFTPTLVTT